MLQVMTPSLRYIYNRNAEDQVWVSTGLFPATANVPYFLHIRFFFHIIYLRNI